MNVPPIQIPDSLQGFSTIPDSVANARLYSGAGSPTGEAAQDTITAESVFGASSRLADFSDFAASGVAGSPAVTDNIVFQLFSIACFIAFCLITYFFRGQVIGIFGVLRGTAQTEKMFGQQSRIYDIFLGWTITLGLLVGGMTAIKFTAVALGPHIAAEVPQWAAFAMVPAVWALCALIFGFQFAVLKLAGSLTLSADFTSKLFYLKKIILALSTLLLTPAFLLFVLSDGTGTDILMWIVAFIIAGMVIFLIIRTFMLFMRENLSISLWFLYLCAVEIFPASLIWIIAGRFLGESV